MLQKDFLIEIQYIHDYPSDCKQLCVPNFQHTTDPDIVSTITKQSEDEEEERNSVHINHSV
jgi:hypothetical protein